MTQGIRTLAGLCFATLLLAACASTQVPANRGDMRAPETLYMAEWASNFRSDRLPQGFADQANAASCRAEPMSQAILALPTADPRELRDEPTLAPGDVLEVTVEDDELFSGAVIIGNNGTLSLRALPVVEAAGTTAPNLASELVRTLEEARIYRRGYATVSVQVKAWAPVDVFVEGAVFQEGRVTVNNPSPAAAHNDRREMPGDEGRPRTVSNALRAAAGVRPDADLTRVVLVRDGRRYMLDLSGFVEGHEARDPFIEANDKIVVPSMGCFQDELARPSTVTMPGMRIFLSNLTTPARANAPSAVSRDAQSVPYGTRMSHAMFSANCVGGTQVTNAGRFAILFSTDPITKEQIVISRPVESLMRRADRREFNPVLMPGDSLACYDSVVTNVRDVMSMFGEIIGPGLLAVSVAESIE